MRTSLGHWFDLKPDQADPLDIDEAIRSGSRVKGTNLWVLMFAILIASVGLNVNSTAVIIGAMLISPLMGPIVGMGYAAAVADLPLIRLAASRLGVFVLLSLLTSTLYFLLSPLDEPGSELLARTQPTLWDVLIAAFGGAAGMVAATRRNFSNIVPGVAIATALMPPLCTVGFGLASARWSMAGGAFYLFVINCVFIAASTLAVAKWLKLHPLGEIDAATRMRHRWIIGWILLAVLGPSIWQGYQLVQGELFQRAAREAVRTMESSSGTAVLNTQIDAEHRRIVLTVVGKDAAQRLEKAAANATAAAGVPNAEVVLRRVGDDAPDLGRLRREFQDEVSRLLARQVHDLEQRVRPLEAAASAAASAAAQVPVRLAPELTERLARELQALGPGIERVEAALLPSGRVLVLVESERALTRGLREQLQRWIAVRLAPAEVDWVERVKPLRRG